MVIIHTDGMTEARNPSGEMLGEPGLLELAQRTAGQTLSAIGEPGPAMPVACATASSAALQERGEPQVATQDRPQVSVITPRTAHIIGQTLIDAVNGRRGSMPADDDQTMVVPYHSSGPAPRLTLGRAARSMAKTLGLRWCVQKRGLAEP